MHYQDFSYTHDWDTILDLCENFDTIETDIKTSQFKQQAATYLDIPPHKKLTRHELRQLLAKAEKMKVSNKKEVRHRGLLLAKQIERIFNINK
jgi:hypothetical protein